MYIASFSILNNFCYNLFIYFTALTGICYFFLRINDRPITTANIANEVNFGLIDANDGKLLSGIENMLAKVLVPALKSQQSWGRLSDNGASEIQEVIDIYPKNI